MHTSNPLLRILVICGIATAIPTTSQPKYYSLEQNARFENDATIVPIIGLQPVGLYLDLYFNGFSGDSKIIDPVSSIKAQSPTKIVGYGTSVIATIQQGQPALTVVYQDTTINFFDLTSFYFGIEVDLKPSQGDVPTAGTLTIECIDPKGKSIKKKDFRFETNGGLVQDMLQVKPTGFKGCQKVNFYTKSDNPLVQTLVATLLDTFKYTVYSKKPLNSAK